MRLLTTHVLLILFAASSLAFGQHIETIPCASQVFSAPFGEAPPPPHRNVLPVGRTRNGFEYTGILRFDVEAVSPFADHLITARLFLRSLDAHENVIIVPFHSGSAPARQDGAWEISGDHSITSRYGKFQVADVTDLVRPWLTHESSNEGLVLLPISGELALFFGKESEWSPYLQLEFDSDIRRADLKVVSGGASAALMQDAVLRETEEGLPLRREPLSTPGEFRWSGLRAGTYILEVYGPSSDVFQGSTLLACARPELRNGETSVLSLKPDLPRFDHVEYHDPVSGAVLHRTDDIPSGSEVLVNLHLYNPNQDTMRVRARVLMDRSASFPFDGELFTLPVDIPPSEEGKASASTPSLLEAGTYLIAVEIQTFVGGRWVRTDAREWNRQSTGILAVSPLTFFGEIRDGISGNPVFGAQLIIKNSLDGGTTSDRAGRFSLAGLLAGEYVVTFSKSGYESKEVKVLLPGPDPVVVTLLPTNAPLGLRP